MMRAPDALPLHLMLMMMQSGLLPNALPFSSGNWPNFVNPFLPKPKTPFEQGSDLLQKLNQQFSEQLSGLSQQLSEPWLKALNPQEKPSVNKEYVSSRVYPGIQPSRTAGPRDKPGVTDTEKNPWTDMFPHFLQPEFLTALSEKAYANSAGFMQGMQAYLTSDYKRPATKYRTLWKRGSATLLDLDPQNKDGVAILCVPSLINKSYVLDLYPERSLVQYLKAQGFRPLILDWGIPGDDELSFTTADYMTGYALDALQTLREDHDGPIALLGYCMGGIFTVAMAQLAQLYVDALILLATPWDFSAEDTPCVLLEPATQTMLRQWTQGQNPVPPLVTQTLFHLINPWRVQEKYSRYPTLDADEKRHFLAVEQWVNDGVALPKAVAEECFVDWPQGNILANHQWKVGRRWIEPGSITCPTLAVLPTKDAIVPLGVSTPLTKEIPRCDVIKPESGHVSMVVGKNAKAMLWKPLVSWLNEKFSD